MKTKTIKQTVKIKATTHDVYESLMDSKKHSDFTGQKAEISRKEGGKFSAYDGYIEGKNLELKPNKKIVQSWRDSDFPENHLSRVTLDLNDSKGYTIIKFTHENVPENLYKETKLGWNDYYWKPMKEMLEM